jgi:hypothetical protein
VNEVLRIVMGLLFFFTFWSVACFLFYFLRFFGGHTGYGKSFWFFYGFGFCVCLYVGGAGTGKRGYGLLLPYCCRQAARIFTLRDIFHS